MRGKDPDWITRRYAERYCDGVGELAAYVPWLGVGDVPSRGVCTRFTGRKAGREHVALSELEHDAILVAQWLDATTDIREQFPLWPLDETLAIAAELGVAHPAHAGQPVLMTTDLVLTVVRDGVAAFEPVTVKPEGELGDVRTLEKFEIERLYWKRRDGRLGIVTRKDVPAGLAANLRWVDGYHDIPEATLDAGAARLAETYLLDLLQRDRDVALNAVCAGADDRLGHEPGTCLGVVRHAISRKRWRVPLGERIVPSRPLPPIDEAIPPPGPGRGGDAR